MSNTQSAHVYTSNQVRLIPVIGSIGFEDPEREDRRFRIVDSRAASDIPPPGALNLDAVHLPDAWQHQILERLDWRGNSMWLGSQHNDVMLHRHRAPYELPHWPERVGKWTAHFSRKDEAGVKWNRTGVCVVDDFGWLVEVPTC